MGDYDSVYGFRALGLDTYTVDEKDEAEKLLKKLSEEETGIIYMTEKLAGELGEILDEYRDRAVPAVILIPGASGNTGAGVLGVSESVKQAVGSDILFSGNDA